MASYRYVDRHKVSDACYEIYEEVVRSGKDMTAAEVKKTLLRIEKAIKCVDGEDVVPVKHGMWHDVYIVYEQLVSQTCSCCNNSTVRSVASVFHYCPACGAKMDMNLV